MADIFAILGGIISSIVKVFSWVWWIAIPLALFFVAVDLWTNYVRIKYLKSVKYKLLEIRIPANLVKTPKSMENIFSTFHAMKISVDSFKKKYIEGKVQLWLSLEMVGNGGGISFYIRTPEEFRNLVEAQIYAQYPQTEIVEVDDYVNLISKDLPNKYYDLFGAEYQFARPSPYPIRTYEFFEEIKEEKRIDPLASIIETMSKLKSDEKIWIQILIKYPKDDWKKEADELVGKLAGKKAPQKDESLWSWIILFFINLIKAPFVPPEWGGAPEKEAPASKVSFLTPGEKEIVDSIETKAAKLGFETVIRFLYIDKRDAFSRLNISSIMGALNQFNTQNLNSFKVHKETMTKADPPFKAQKEFLKKRQLYNAYRLRSFRGGLKTILNTEELATIYHFPIVAVEGPSLRRIEAKKGEPPINLPV